MPRSFLATPPIGFVACCLRAKGQAQEQLQRDVQQLAKGDKLVANFLSGIYTDSLQVLQAAPCAHAPAGNHSTDAISFSSVARKEVPMLYPLRHPGGSHILF